MRCSAYIQGQNWDAEILVVNDGSSDDTAQIVREYAQAHPQILLVENPGNRGKGYSVRNGMLHARGDHLPVHRCRSFFADRGGAETVRRDCSGRRHRHRIALAAGGPADRTAAVVPAGIWTNLQSGAAGDSRLAFRGHAMRIQSLSAGCGATHFSFAEN